MSKFITKESETVWQLEGASELYRLALLQQLKAKSFQEKKEAFEEKKEALYKMREILNELEVHIQQEEMFAASAVADE